MDLPDDIDWVGYLKGDPVEGIHWHGFFWRGPAAQIYMYKHQSERTAGTPEFRSGDTPPEMLAHHLLRPRLVRGTFTAPDDVVDWMHQQWKENEPETSHRQPSRMLGYCHRMLTLGKDVVWSWDYPRSGDNTSVRVYGICCPRWDFPDIACPRPPRG